MGRTSTLKPGEKMYIIPREEPTRDDRIEITNHTRGEMPVRLGLSGTGYTDETGESIGEETLVDYNGTLTLIPHTNIRTMLTITNLSKARRKLTINASGIYNLATPERVNKAGDLANYLLINDLRI